MTNSKKAETTAGKTTCSSAKLPACPPRLEQLIKEMWAIEVRLGNLQPIENEAEAWQTADLDQMYKRLANADNDEAAVESLFRQVVNGLQTENLAADQIATLINARMKGQSRLPYCDEADVREAFKNPLQ